MKAFERRGEPTRGVWRVQERGVGGREASERVGKEMGISIGRWKREGRETGIRGAGDTE